MSLPKNEWKLTTLDKLGKVESGKPLPCKIEDSHVFFEGGYIPLIDGEAISKSRLYIKKCKRHFNCRGLKSNKLFPKNTVCIVRVGSSVGKTAILKKDSCLTETILTFNSEKKELFIQYFVKYCLDSSDSKKKILSMAKAVTAQPGLYLNKFLSIRFFVPSFIIQQKIGDILSAYDELIENSEKQIEVLQNIRTSIFKEWFVNLRFPNNNGLSLDDLITVGGAEMLKNWVILSQLKEEKFQLRILLRKEDIHFLLLLKIVQKESINILITCLQL